MNPSSREGWSVNPPPSANEAQPPNSRPMGPFGSAGASQQQSPPSSAQQGPPTLPPPGSSYFQPSNSLPPLSNLASVQGSPGRPQSYNQEAPSGNQGLGQPLTSYSLPRIDQAVQQHAVPPNIPDRERERDRDPQRDPRDADMADRHMEDVSMRDAEQQRDRELRERQQRELHQPVAVPPHVRSIHGPNGLLGNAAPGNAGNAASTPIPNSAPPSVYPGSHIAASAPPSQQQALSVMAAYPPNLQQVAGMGGQGQQPILNDALSYLDQVKVQFVDNPDVYNRFLDIMKDFKSGAIDTPGVIDRVSNLFAGNANLIQGFNTFLPPGYKIECGTSEDPNAIRVTTPMGTTVSTMPQPRPAADQRQVSMNGAGPVQNDRQYYDSRTPGNAWQGPPGSAPENAYSPNGPPAAAAAFGAPGGANANVAAVDPQREQQNIAATPAQDARQLQTTPGTGAFGRPNVLSPPRAMATPVAAQQMNGLAMQQGGVGSERRGPVEFNHAISYVNKIKNRFATQPDIYKQFLEILQTYQRESKPIQDVYAQVTKLFETAPDLLEDFKQFLPESAAHARAAAAAKAAADEQAPVSNIRGEQAYPAGATPFPVQQQTPRAEQGRLPPVGNFAPTPSANRDNKRKRGGVQPVGTVAAGQVSTVQETGGRGTGAAAGLSKKTKQAQPVRAAEPSAPDVAPSLVPTLPTPLPPTSKESDQEYQQLFERVKKYLNNKTQMNEFLKLCLLWSRDVLDTVLFIHRAHSFIGGNPDLFNLLKRAVRYDEWKRISDSTKGSSNAVMGARADLNRCRGLGPSYRLVPLQVTTVPCEGRDNLCREVLNDHWTSHPTWASEESGFVAHKKNSFEELLHRIEEERHDYDSNIEALGRTVQLLEPIAQHIRQLPHDQRHSFVLPPGLGGQSQTIYKRVIMKLYGRETGAKVIDHLFKEPWKVVGPLLLRLKQKFEDWNNARYEWNKIWLDLTSKNFWKSLDHQSAEQKKDKRVFQPKTLLNDITTIYDEHRRRATVHGIKIPAYQYKFSFTEAEVVLDVAYLVVVYAETNNQLEALKVETFMKEFLTTFFDYDKQRFEARMAARRENRANNGVTADSPDNKDEQPPRTARSRNTELLRKAVDPRRAEKAAGERDESPASASQATSPNESSAPDDDVVETSEQPPAEESEVENAMSAEKWLNTPDGQLPAAMDKNTPYVRKIFDLYCNQNFYFFFRCFNTLYERLCNIRNDEAEARRQVTHMEQNLVAKDLKVFEKLAADYWEDISETANFYEQVVFMLEQQLVGDLPMSDIEDTLRRFYMQHGWQLYNFEKLISNLHKYAATVADTDGKDKEIWNSFKKDRAKVETTAGEQLAYRTHVEKQIKEGELFCISWNTADESAGVKIVKTGDLTFNMSALSEEGRFAFYIHAFCTLKPTEGVDVGRVAFPLLHRSLPPDLVEHERAYTDRIRRARIQESLQVHLKSEDYHLQFKPLGEESTFPGVAVPSSDAGEGETYVPSMYTPGFDAPRLADPGRERLILNARWMKDLSTDDVGARKKAFQDKIEGRVDAEAEAQDVEMADAE
ncbi:hypothetical protein P152DRAFT_28189 [Eremomyces bilateralis CBS 781.70]|uniref:Histone deacetylase interacting domain-containing protein n=1 Tax=Eremomyces bilateralis CBS 781.70 TaxID=1392243 RepID=A0A6G1G324_9PEZI|nr:uncharacterized protein P152DRAFT_28189 [Eremomyces bilateralis CBS 781.70]KAF1812209.1 hypothetical protein P152DRAFT_28189 [Eremomyces bilateralis CBS 781.70]